MKYGKLVALIATLAAAVSLYLFAGDVQGAPEAAAGLLSLVTLLAGRAWGQHSANGKNQGGFVRISAVHALLLVSAIVGLVASCGLQSRQNAAKLLNDLVRYGEVVRGSAAAVCSAVLAECAGSESEKCRDRAVACITIAKALQGSQATAKAIADELGAVDADAGASE